MQLYISILFAGILSKLLSLFVTFTHAEMKMEVMMMPSLLSVDSNFNSACNSPYISAHSSPQRFGTSFFYSAPTSPTRDTAVGQDFVAGDNFFTVATGGCSLLAIPFDWEEKPGIPKAKEALLSTKASSNYGDADEDFKDSDFAFDFSGQFERSSLSAEELFDGGKIKPLMPPPGFEYNQNKPLGSPKSPRSPKKLIREALSPRHRKKEFDPFEAALEHTRKSNIQESSNDKRGRDRINNSSIPSNSRHKGTRSLSPFRVSDLLLDPNLNQEPTTKNSSSNIPLSSTSSFSSTWYKKWKIKDLLLFRSASESRATEKDNQLKKYTIPNKTHQDEVKDSSFRSTDSVGSVSSRRRSGVPISAHELHYTVNRAVSEEMKKRTPLPYKQGLLGCLGFHPTVPEIPQCHEFSVSMSRG